MIDFAAHYVSCLHKTAAGDLDQNLRALSPEEIADVQSKRHRLLAGRVSVDDPVSGVLSSPALPTMAGGLLGAVGGAGIGGLIGHLMHGNPAEVNRLMGTSAIVGGIQGGRLGYQAKQRHNEHAIDKLREYPEGEATLRRVLTDHYQQQLARYAV